MHVSRVHRLLKLISVLSSGQAKGVKQLMEELEVSRRTLFRDLNMLEAAGVPYYHEKGVGYRISSDFFLPPISLTAGEALGLMLLGKGAAAQRDKPMFAAALSGIYKLVSTMPEPIRSTCGEMMGNVTVDVGAVGEGERESQVYMTLQRCIEEGRVCKVEYMSPVGGWGFKGKVRPYCLHFAARAWYLFGWSQEHGEVRVLKLARIGDLKVTDELFTRPVDFNVSQVLDGAWALNPEGKMWDVELEFSAMVGTNVSETRWHSSQEIESLEDGKSLVRFKVNGLNEIAWWVCGYADQVKVNKPRELREIVRKRMMKAVENMSEEVGVCV